MVVFVKIKLSRMKSNRNYFLLTFLSITYATIGYSQVVNSMSGCSVEVTLYCDHDADCDGGCDTTFCLGPTSSTGGSALPPKCHPVCTNGYTKAKVCVLSGACTSGPCNGTGIPSDGCSGDCQEVSYSGCNGLPQVANATNCCCTPSSTAVDWTIPTLISISN